MSADSNNNFWLCEMCRSRAAVGRYTISNDSQATIEEEGVFYTVPTLVEETKDLCQECVNSFSSTTSRRQYRFGRTYY